MRLTVSRVAFIRNNSQSPFFGNSLSDYAAAISFIGNNGEGWLFPVKEKACISLLS